MAMAAARLPLGLPTLAKVRKGGYAYVDKCLALLLSCSIKNRLVTISFIYW